MTTLRDRWIQRRSLYHDIRAVMHRGQATELVFARLFQNDASRVLTRGFAVLRWWQRDVSNFTEHMSRTLRLDCCWCGRHASGRKGDLRRIANDWNNITVHPQNSISCGVTTGIERGHANDLHEHTGAHTSESTPSYAPEIGHLLCGRRSWP